MQEKWLKCTETMWWICNGLVGMLKVSTTTKPIIDPINFTLFILMADMIQGVIFQSLHDHDFLVYFSKKLSNATKYYISGLLPISRWIPRWSKTYLTVKIKRKTTWTFPTTAENIDNITRTSNCLICLWRTHELFLLWTRQNYFVQEHSTSHVISVQKSHSRRSQKKSHSM